MSMKRNCLGLPIVRLMLAAALAGSTSVAIAQNDALRVSVSMFGNDNVPSIRVTNYSGEQITKFELTIGHTGYHFDGASVSAHPPGGTAVVAAPVDRGDTIVVNLLCTVRDTAVGAVAPLGRVFVAGIESTVETSELYGNANHSSCHLLSTARDCVLRPRCSVLSS